MLINIVLAEETKILKRPLLWIELVVLAGLTILLASGLYTVGDADERRQVLWPLAPITMLEFAIIFGSFFTVVLVGSIVAQDYTWRTLHLWLSHGVGRPTLLLGKFVAFVLPLLLLALVPLLVGAPLSAIFTIRDGGSIDLGQISYPRLAFSVVRTAYALLPYAAVTVLLGVVSRNAVGPLAGGIAFVMGENLLGQVLSMAGVNGLALVRLLPAGLATGLARANSGSVAGTVDVGLAGVANMLPVPQAALGVALYTLLFLGMALWIFRRQDLTG